jgi:orotidine 5''-phosphate decarboxylase, subfamily 2
MREYFERLGQLSVARGALCAGVDPHPGVLASWGLDNSAASLERFSRSLVEALGDQLAVFKPQSAFFESFGSAGIAVLERLLADIRGTGALSILDVKRGDIGSTMEAYADAYLADGSTLAADAITVSPFLGFGSLQPAFDRAREYGRGVYVLARTSNPEGGRVQLADQSGRSVVQEIVDEATQANAASGTRAIGLVVGGTHQDLGCDLTGFNGSILVPGIGAQGGRMADLPALFGPAFSLILPMVGRELIGAGPDPKALRDKAAQLLEPLRAVTRNDS